VSAEVNQELKAAFETASEFVRPHPELAERARAGARRRRRRTLAATAGACAAVLVIAGSAYAAAGHHQHAGALSRPANSPRVLATVDYQVTQLAVSGRYLYLLAGQNSLLTAYDAATGKLIRQVHLPNDAPALAIGPGGLVWLAYSPDQGGGGPTGVWLLSPDLRLHSAYTGLRTNTILPSGPTTARIADQHGLVRLQLPMPGQSGRATAHRVPGSSLGASPGIAPGWWSGEIGGRIAVLVTNAGVNDGHLVLAGLPGLRFGGGWQTHISAVTSTGSSLWVTTYTQRNGETSLSGPLVRLDSRLAVSTPAPMHSSQVLARSESVWSAGDTIWVATDARGHSLVCFTAGRTIGPVTTMPVSGEVVALSATASTVYVNALQPPGSYAPSHVVAYQVPAACR